MKIRENSVYKDTKNIVVSGVNGNKILIEEKTGGDRVIYRLLSSVKEIEGKNTDVYGIQIISTLFGSNEESTVVDITSDLDFAKELFHIISENLVLPVSLKEIVEDYINAKYS